MPFQPLKKSEYDTDGNGAVDSADDSDTVDGKHASQLGSGTGEKALWYAGL